MAAITDVAVLGVGYALTAVAALFAALTALAIGQWGLRKVLALFRGRG
jgi:hypothetical protein